MQFGWALNMDILIAGATSSHIFWHVAAGVGAKSGGKITPVTGIIVNTFSTGDRDDHQDHGEGEDQVWPVLARAWG